MEKLKYTGFLLFIIGAISKITYFSPGWAPWLANSFLTLSAIVLSFYCIKKIIK